MGGGASGSRQKSSSVSKPVNTPEQVAIYKWMEQNIVPLAEGQDTYLSKLINQRIAQEGQRLQQSQEEQNRSMGNLPGMSAGIMEQMNKNTADMGTQSVLGQQLANKQALQSQALQMLGGIPMSPGQKSKSSASSWQSSSWAGVVPSKPTQTQAPKQAPSSYTTADMSGETRVTPEMQAQMQAQLQGQTMVPQSMQTQTQNPYLK